MDSYCDRGWCDFLDRRCADLRRSRRLADKLLHRRLLKRRDECRAILRVNRRLFARLQEIAGAQAQCLRLAGVRPLKSSSYYNSPCFPAVSSGGEDDNDNNKIQQLLDLFRQEDDEECDEETLLLGSTQDTTTSAAASVPLNSRLLPPANTNTPEHRCKCRRRGSRAGSRVARSPAAGSPATGSSPLEDSPQFKPTPSTGDDDGDSPSPPLFSSSSSARQPPRVDLLAHQWAAASGGSRDFANLPEDYDNLEELSIFDYRRGEVATAGTASSTTTLWRPPRSAPCLSSLPCGGTGGPAQRLQQENFLWTRIHRRIERLREHCRVFDQ